MHDLSNIPVIPALLAASLASAAAARTAHRRPRISGPREPRVWLSFAILFVAFVIIKCFGAIEALETAARNQIRADGMYDDRRILQLVIVSAAGIFGIAQGLWYAKHIAQRWKRYRWSLIGSLAIVCFAVMRAVSLHELDALGMSLTIAKVAVEIAASLLAAWGAWQRVTELRGAPPARRFEGRPA